jgi:hypothetical protein
MLRKTLIAAVLGFALAAGAGAAEVIVRIGPPAPIHERRIARPGPGYIWTPGYHRWDGRAYVWAPGAWVLPPRPHAVWVPHRWERRNGGWVMIEGHWR